MELLLFAIFFLVLAAFAVTASELGVDSRDGADDTYRPSTHVGSI